MQQAPESPAAAVISFCAAATSCDELCDCFFSLLRPLRMLCRRQHVSDGERHGRPVI